MRERESVVSEHPRDDEELEAFLKGDSTLSRRYREAGDEQPPAKVDAAILAASQWAVGADPGKDNQKRDSRRSVRASNAGSNWWSGFFSRWSVPLATAAVFVIAATLTLMIEREPELERIERQSDSIALNAPDKRSGDMLAELAQQDVDATAERSSASPSPDEPASAPVKSKPEKSTQAQSEPVKASPPAATSTAPRRLEFRPVEEEAPVVAKDSDARKEAVSASGRLEKPPAETVAGFAGDMAQPTAPPVEVSASLVEEKAVVEQESVAEELVVPAERRRDNDAMLAGDIPPTEMSPDQSTAAVTGLAGAQRNAAEPADEIASLQAQSEESDALMAPPPTQFAPAQSVPVSPATSGTRSAGRDPDKWIADIEEQLALGNRELARAAVKNFRERYPDYELPEALEELLSVNDP